MTKNQTLVVTATTGDAKAPTTRRCNCGCGEATSSTKTQYKPGHDARHASAVARRIVEGNLHGDAAEAELAKLGSDKLHHKAAAMVNRLLEKANKPAKAPKAPKVPADKKSRSEKREIALTVAEEEDAHNKAEAAKRAEIEAELAQSDDWDAATLGEVKMGRWTYPTRTLNGETQRYTKTTLAADGGSWVAFNGK